MLLLGETVEVVVEVVLMKEELFSLLGEVDLMKEELFSPFGETSPGLLASLLGETVLLKELLLLLLLPSVLLSLIVSRIAL